jgi:hypothetical protein
MPSGLDSDYVTGGVDYGPVRRPLPIAKAFENTILAYELNGQPLPPDNGHPVRLVVPGWVGVANIKWVGQIQVSREPLYSYWNTTNYILEGPAYPNPIPLSTQAVKSAFELASDATLPNQRQILTGRSGTRPDQASGHQHRRRRQLAAGQAELAQPPQCLGALGVPLVTARPGELHAPGARQRLGRTNAARHCSVQHTRLLVLGNRQAPDHSGELAALTVRMRAC